MRKLRQALLLLVLAANTAFAAEFVVNFGPCPIGDEFWYLPERRCFYPDELTIDLGDTVTFRHDLSSFGSGPQDKHNVAADGLSFRCARGCDDDGGDGSPSATAWTFSRTFRTPGTVVYHDQMSYAGGVIIVRAASAFAIGPGITGTWFNPAHDGHGLFVEALPGNRFLAWWFAFDPANGEQAWFFGVGTYQGATANIPGVHRITGGRWIPDFDPARTAVNAWGSLSFTFTDCNHGRVDFASVAGYGSGSMDLTRMTLPAGLTCQ